MWIIVSINFSVSYVCIYVCVCISYTHAKSWLSPKSEVKLRTGVIIKILYKCSGGITVLYTSKMPLPKQSGFGKLQKLNQLPVVTVV